MRTLVATSAFLSQLVLATGEALPEAWTPREASAAVQMLVGAMRADSSPQQGRLTGSWEVRIQLEGSSGLGDARSRVARGNLVIRAPQTLANGLPSERGVQSGTFDIDFSDLGFSLATTDALAWLVGTDSVRIKLHPAVAAGAVEMQGTFFDAKVIGGTWTWRSGARMASGSFVLRR